MEQRAEVPRRPSCEAHAETFTIGAEFNLFDHSPRLPVAKACGQHELDVQLHVANGRYTPSRT
jgi:hypothetical protein